MSLSHKQKLREQYRVTRAERLRKEILKNIPTFVLLYGGGKRLRPWWQYIACSKKSDNCLQTRSITGRWDADFVRRDNTVFVSLNTL